VELEAARAAGDFAAMPKKEALSHERELEKLDRNLGGLRRLDRPPDAIFVIDTKKEHIAVTEANKLHLPVVAVVDTNCDPDVIDYVIPGNDDAIRAGRLMCRVIADAVVEGRFIASRRAVDAANRARRASQEAAVQQAAPVLNEPAQPSISEIEASLAKDAAAPAPPVEPVAEQVAPAAVAPEVEPAPPVEPVQVSEELAAQPPATEAGEAEAVVREAGEISATTAEDTSAAPAIENPTED
jgi:small subunit ribosomal protein S2